MNWFTPSQTYPAIKQNVDTAEYMALGRNYERGNPRRIISRSELVEFSKCPRRWKLGMKKDDTSATDWGSLIDCLVLTPDEFEKRYAVTPETYPAVGKKKDDLPTEKPWNRNATYCAEWETGERAQGRECIKPMEAAEAHKAAARIKQDDKMRDFIACSDRQVQVLVDYHDDATGLVIPVKCLLDLVPSPESEYGDTLGDFKTCRSAHPRAWGKAVAEHHYHWQAALFMDAYNAASGLKYERFAHLVQENFAPYEIGRRILSDDFLQIGRAEYRRALADYCACLEANDFPGYEDWPDHRGRVVDGWRVVEPEDWMMKEDPDYGFGPAREMPKLEEVA